VAGCDDNRVTKEAIVPPPIMTSPPPSPSCAVRVDGEKAPARSANACTFNEAYCAPSGVPSGRVPVTSYTKLSRPVCGVTDDLVVHRAMAVCSSPGRNSGPAELSKSLMMKSREERPGLVRDDLADGQRDAARPPGRRSTGSPVIGTGTHGKPRSTENANVRQQPDRSPEVEGGAWHRSYLRERIYRRRNISRLPEARSGFYHRIRFIRGWARHGCSGGHR
jgi:hypothetical protein